MVRIAYFCAYAVVAALGEALVARPGLIWLRSQGIFHAVLPWDVPLGGLLLSCAALLAVFTLWFASDVAQRRRPQMPLHAAFLLLFGICFVLRQTAGDPRPPRDPAPSLLEALRIAAAELDRSYSGQYAPDAAQFSSALAQVSPPGFRRLGRAIPLHARILSGAEGARLDPLEGDQPGTIYVSISKDRQSAWLTALAGHGTVLRLPSGQPAVVEAHGGSHSLPGRDPLVPEYPRSRPGVP
ncbi:MAG TPA: hypothetical protein VFL36_07175 [Myxococcales bacterium]|nr:hypothetical protein [Myxococcales bacterium]